ncbi:MAG: InlB B-repeat-containing protein [Oscillospiraceae bacterium]|nr:InlB B-repeat-containing protein [Oscillospiraceae bacterium]
MRKTAVRGLSLLLCLALCLTLLPQTAFADDGALIELVDEQPEELPSAGEELLLLDESEETARGRIEEPEADGTGRGSYVNPFYAAYFTEDSLFEEELYASREAERPAYFCVSLTDISGAVKEMLLKRTANATITFSSSSYLSDSEVFERVWNAFDAAYQHNGVPTEGDYLLSQYVGWSYTYTRKSVSGGYRYELEMTLVLLTNAAQEREIDTEIDRLIDVLGLEDMTELEKIRTVYDYMTETIRYDYDRLYDDSYTLKYTVYNALFEHTAVCAAYAALMYRLLLEVGVDCRVIVGNNGDHAWNIVRVGNLYYNMDATWDEGCSYYSWYLRGADSFPSHTRNAPYLTDDFNAAHPTSGTSFNEDLPRIDFDRSRVDLTAGTGESRTVILTATNYYRQLSFTAYRPDGVSTSWGGWSGVSIPLTVTASKAGTYNMVIELIDYETKNAVASGVLTIRAVDPSAAARYTISYDANGGTGAPAAQSKIPDVTLTLSSQRPTRKGCCFLGWSVDKTAAEPEYFAGGEFTGNISARLYAVWGSDAYVPKGLSTDNNGTTGRVRLSWQPVAGATGYHVYRSLSADGSYEKLTAAPITDTVYTDNRSGSAGTRFYYRVAAVRGGLEYCSGEAVSQVSRCQRPTGLTASANSDGSVTLRWDEPLVRGSVSFYRVYLWHGETAVWIGEEGSHLTASGTSVTVPARYLIDGERAEFSVRGCNSKNVVGSISTYSAPAAAVSRSTQLKPPGVVVCDNNGTTGRVRLSWQASAGAAGYNVYRSLSADGSYEKLNASPVTGTVYTDNRSGSAGTRFYYRVSAVSGERESACGRTVSQVSRCQRPTGLTARAHSNGSVTLSWEAPLVKGSVSAYRIYVWDGDRFVWIGEEGSHLTASGTSVTVPARYLASGVPTEFSVRGYNSKDLLGSISIYAATVTVTPR